MGFRFYTDGDLPGDENMARDIRLLEAAESGVFGCRVYGWDDVWVSLGRYQSAEKDLLGPVNHVVRPTGGKAVLHGHDVTVGLASPLSMLEVDERSIRSIYRAVATPLIVALNGCGVPAALAENTAHAGRGQRTADCFAFCSPNDIVDRVTGRKVCGVALRVTERAVLLQASIPNGAPRVDASHLIRNASSAAGEPWDATMFDSHLEIALLSTLQVPA